MSFANRPNNRNPAGYAALRGAVGPHFPQLDAKIIKDFIGDFSSSVKYWKAVQCPCMTPETGQPNLACNVCRGLGWAYNSSETDYIYQHAQVHSRKSQRLTEAGGMITQGYASITFLPGVVPGEGDLVQICADKEVVNDEYHVVQSVLTDGSSAETLRFRDVICVEQVTVEIENNVQFLGPCDWSFNAAGRFIQFTKPRPAGTKYSVRYQAVPEYILRQETAKPLLRVTHDRNYNDPYSYGGKNGKDIVFPFNCQAIRLDRAIVQRQRGNIDFNTQSTFNNRQGRGPFR